MAVLLGLVGSLLLAPAALAGPASLDRSFGAAGVVDLRSVSTGAFPGLSSSPTAMAAGKGGQVFVLGSSYACDALAPFACRDHLIVTALGSRGAVDEGYGRRGSSVLGPVAGGQGRWAQLAVDSRGRVVVAAPDEGGVRVFRLGRAGGLDRSFGDRGSALVAGSWHRAPWLGLTAEDAPVVVDVRTVHPAVDGRFSSDVVVTRLLPDGRRDRRFGPDGTRSIVFRNSDQSIVAAIEPRGGVILAGVGCCRRAEPLRTARLRPDGRRDSRFGDLPLRGRGKPTAVRAISIRRGGKIDIAGAARSGQRGFLVRLRPDGAVQRRFGRGGVRQPPWPIDAAALDRRGRTFAVSDSSGGRAVFRLSAGGGLDRSFSNGTEVNDLQSGEGVAVAYSGFHPLVFSDGLVFCRTACPPKPRLARFVGGPLYRHNGRHHRR